MNDLNALALAAAEMVDTIGNQAAADKATFEQAYRLGFESGVVVGRKQLEAEIMAEEERFGAHMSTISRMKSHAEMEAIRYPGYTREELQELRKWCAA